MTRVYNPDRVGIGYHGQTFAVYQVRDDGSEMLWGLTNAENGGFLAECVKKHPDTASVRVKLAVTRRQKASVMSDGTETAAQAQVENPSGGESCARPQQDEGHSEPSLARQTVDRIVAYSSNPGEALVQRPSVGGVVHYRSHCNPNKGQPYPATITHVHEDGTVNLNIANDADWPLQGNERMPVRVPLFASGDKLPAGSCVWPPRV